MNKYDKRVHRSSFFIEGAAGVLDIFVLSTVSELGNAKVSVWITN